MNGKALSLSAFPAYIPLMQCLLSCVLLLAIGQSQPVRYDEPTPVGRRLVADATAGEGVFERAARPWFKWINDEEATIDSALAALKEKGASQSHLSEQLARAMMRLADKDRQPPWALVATFADNLTRDLVGSQLTGTQNMALRECLSEAMRRTGTSNARLATRLQEILAAVALKSSRTQAIINDFIRLRESVQGPDDISNRQLNR